MNEKNVSCVVIECLAQISVNIIKTVNPHNKDCFISYCSTAAHFTWWLRVNTLWLHQCIYKTVSDLMEA